ncbi:MAG: non-canonical purine NTP pyrophosphatase [Planctomycetota bacterium]|nr:MAG: non-canonical purine NTP pyrophosphatase [Planctomycetota bacterium]
MKGEFENRLKSVIEEVQASPVPIILFIDETHTLIGAGGAAGGEGIWVLADDSGLCVDALNGAPGVRSARYSGTEGVRRDGANNEKLLRAMEDVADAERGAAFFCAIAVVHNGEVLFAVEGSVRGRILREADGVDGFGYDPLFFHAPSRTSFARLSAAEKAEVSHRGMAVGALRVRLAELLGPEATSA